MDDIDCAAERVEAFRDVALRLVLDRMSGPPSSGVCQVCSDTIEPQRLALVPSTRRCSFCAAEEEAHARTARLRGSVRRS